MRASGKAMAVLGLLCCLTGGPQDVLAAERAPVAEYTFDEGAGSVLRDRTGNGNDGRIHGARFVRSGGGFALSFDGKDDAVVIQPSDSLKFDEAVTVEAWVLPLATGPNEPGIVGGGTDVTTHLGLTYYSDESCYFYISHGANHCDAKIGKGKWRHLAGTFDGQTLKLYVDGQPVAQAKTKKSKVNSGDVYFIGRGAHGFFNGLIDDVRLYGRALSADEIAAGYKRGAADKTTGGSVLGAEPGLVALYDFDEGSGETACDRSGHGNSAAIHAAAFAKDGIWQDWLADGVARLIDEYDIDGVYLDTTACVRSEGCANGRHGCGRRRPDGTVAPTFPLFATREAMKRLYTIVRTRKPDGLVDMHNSQFPAVAWGTGVWKGEGLAYNKPYTFEEAHAFTLLHDVPIRGLGGGWLRFNSKLWKLFDAFGRKEARWLPYWKNADFVQVMPQGTDETPGAYCSLYRHDENGVLAVVSNLGREKAEVLVRFDLARLGLGDRAVSATDAVGGEALSIENGAVGFPAMVSMDWRIVRIEGR